MKGVLAVVVVAAAVAVGTCAAVSGGGNAKLTLLSSYEGARCLDGSPGGFYFAPATASANSSKWVFSLQGGGECVTKDSCLGRAKSKLGSSKQWPSTITSEGLQDTSCGDNPHFCTFNQVFVVYCSGDLHVGAQKSPSPDTWGLQFSGHLIVSAVVEELKKTHDLGSATEIVWSGGSAGGIGSFAHCDFISDQVPSAKVFCAPIGGFYFSNKFPYHGTDPKPVGYIPWNYTSLQQYHTLWSAWVPDRCQAAIPSTPWECIFANASYPSTKTPVFFIEGQTDRVVMPLHDGLPAVWNDQPSQCNNDVSNCPRDIVVYMSMWSGLMVQGISQLHSSDRDGYFNPACLIHTEFQFSHPRLNGMSYTEALADWIWNPQSRRYFTDSCGVMCNPTCNG